MYDMSKELRKFISDCVVLHNKEQHELREKKNLNLKRLKDGLSLYNESKNTDYKIAEVRVQGSMAMNTVIQNDARDYDIDVAIIFDNSNIEGLGPLQARRLVADALRFKMGNFAEEPDVKTNCVRIKYQSGYHIDFAVYRRKKSFNGYNYEHAGNEWCRRDPKAINEWFSTEIQRKGKDLRSIIRLSKTFCKSRESWVNMPGGLIQSVVCDEVYKSNNLRIDEVFLHTMTGVINRLKHSKEIYDPTDKDIPLLNAQNHCTKVNNWLTRLERSISCLDVLKEDDCTLQGAYEAWYKFFEHDYWKNLLDSITESFSPTWLASQKIVEHSYTDTEEYIEDKVLSINDTYDLTVTVKVEAKGFSQNTLVEFFAKYPMFNKFLPHGLKIDFYAETNAVQPYDVWWKVRNVGQVAEEKNLIRGQILKDSGHHHREETQFYGPHYVECYIIKNNECVAICRVDVNIGEDEFIGNNYGR